MHLSLGGIVKGITTGLETLVETGNPAIAAGAGAVAFLGSSGNSNQSPILQELQAESPFEQRNVNQLSSYADLIGDAA